LDTTQQHVGRFQSRVWYVMSLRRAVTWVSAWLFVWGVVVLISRGVIGTERQPLVWGAIGIAVAIVAAVTWARRQVPGAQAVRAMFDRQSQAGGLVMARDDAELGDWSAKLPMLRGPRLRWRGGRAWGILAAACVFVCVSFAVPQAFVEITSKQPLDVSQQADELSEQIETLAEEKIIDRSQADELDEKLDQIQAEATADDPVKTWESLDHLRDTLSREADRATEQAMAQTQKLAEAESLAEGLTEDQQSTNPQLDAELNAEAMNHLSQLMKQLQNQNESFKQASAKQGFEPDKLAGDQDKAVKQVFVDKQLDADTRRQVRQALEKLGITSKHAGEVDKQTLRELREALEDKSLSKAEREAMKQKLAEHEMNKSQLPPLSDQQLQQVEQALRELGLSDEQFALVPADQAKQLTREQRKQLREMMQDAEPGKKFRQVYLREGLDARTVLKVHLALAKVQLQSRQDSVIERAGADVMWKLATRTLDKAEPDATGPLFDPGQLDTAVGMIQQASPQTVEQMRKLGVVEDGTVEKLTKMIDENMPSAAEVGRLLDQVDPQQLAQMLGQAAGASDATAWNNHIGLVDSWSIDALWRLLADDWLPDDEMAMLEKNLEPHQLDAAKLPTLNDDALRQINTAFKNIGLSEADFALLPPPQQMTPEQMDQLAKAAGASSAGKLSLKARMAKLKNAKLIDGKTLDALKEAAKSDGKGLAKFLAENAGGMSVSSMMQAWGSPGRGGITRGRGDAAMTWKDPSDPAGARFEEQSLPMANLDALKNSQLTGVSLGAPELSDKQAATQSNALTNTAADGGAASKQTILPRHRAAVRQYFERE